jgi:hypothetical protein
MSGRLEVFISVLTCGGIATADVSASETFAELHPPQAGIDTGLAYITAGLHIRIRLLHMLAFRHEASS